MLSEKSFVNLNLFEEKKIQYKFKKVTNLYRILTETVWKVEKRFGKNFALCSVDWTEIKIHIWIVHNWKGFFSLNSDHF